jgi:hypothetical protein
LIDAVRSSPHPTIASGVKRTLTQTDQIPSILRDSASDNNPLTEKIMSTKKRLFSTARGVCTNDGFNVAIGN